MGDAVCVNDPSLEKLPNPGVTVGGNEKVGKASPSEGVDKMLRDGEMLGKESLLGEPPTMVGEGIPVKVSINVGVDSLEGT